jgi:2-dehydro-3-deoxyphosphogluconate aldolase/(4S)-4-hydroxy-2-oxoglutarate aldolase
MEKALKALLRDGFISVFNQDGLDVVETAKALMDAGFSQMELTCRVTRPLDKLARLKKELPEFICGAASLIDIPATIESYNARNPGDPLPSVRQAVDAGADYLVSAINFRPETYAEFAGKIPLIPGCGSVTEIAAQHALGANMCKLFPASPMGGAAYIKAMDPATHKMMPIVPTGGVNPGNIPEYIGAGVLVVGGSFGMFDERVVRGIVDNRDYALLAEKMTEIKALIDQHRKRKWPGLDFDNASLDEIEKTTGRILNV